MILTFWRYYFYHDFYLIGLIKPDLSKYPLGFTHCWLEITALHDIRWQQVLLHHWHTHTLQDFFWQSLQNTVNISAVREREWITVFLRKISVCLDTHISLVLTVAGPWLSAGGPYLQDICCTWHLSLLQGHELHANSTEAFNTQGFGPHPTGALSQVFSRWDKSLPLRPQTRAQTLGVGAASSG